MNRSSEMWPSDLVALYEADYSTLVGFATGMLGRRAEAEEVVQDAILGLRARWNEVANPGGYLRRSVMNGCTGVLRRRRTAEAGRVDPPPPGEPEYLVELRDALLRLPERQRAAIVLRYFAGRDDIEIAEALGARRSTVRSLVARGLRTLRTEIGRSDAAGSGSHSADFDPNEANRKELGDAQS